MDVDSLAMQALYFMKDIENTSIVHRIGNIERNYVKVFIHEEQR